MIDWKPMKDELKRLQLNVAGRLGPLVAQFALRILRFQDLGSSKHHQPPQKRWKVKAKYSEQAQR
ncbi:MAG: hypothetical protein CL912_33285 [Deltaproteobacteria bacterium]|nr:hypothetical protein [Deltaproteobacteria bacterium]